MAVFEGCDVLVCVRRRFGGKIVGRSSVSEEKQTECQNGRLQRHLAGAPDFLRRPRASDCDGNTALILNNLYTLLISGKILEYGINKQQKEEKIRKKRKKRRTTKKPKKKTN